MPVKIKITDENGKPIEIVAKKVEITHEEGSVSFNFHGEGEPEAAAPPAPEPAKPAEPAPAKPAEPAPAKPADPPAPPTPPAGTWQKIGTERQKLKVPANSRLRFGLGNQWVEKVVSGEFTATNEFFGKDPVIGKVKDVEQFK